MGADSGTAFSARLPPPSERRHRRRGVPGETVSPTTAVAEVSAPGGKHQFIWLGAATELMRRRNQVLLGIKFNHLHLLYMTTLAPAGGTETP
jgi:hypothetical protein